MKVFTRKVQKPPRKDPLDNDEGYYFSFNEKDQQKYPRLKEIYDQSSKEEEVDEYLSKENEYFQKNYFKK